MEINQSLMGLEWHEGAWMMTEFSFLGELYLLCFEFPNIIGSTGIAVSSECTEVISDVKRERFNNKYILNKPFVM